MDSKVLAVVFLSTVIFAVPAVESITAKGVVRLDSYTFDKVRLLILISKIVY